MPLTAGQSLTGTSRTNGDAFFISPDNTTLMLADGASGAGTEGKVMMSRLCVETVGACPFPPSGLSVQAWLDKLIWQINNELIALSQKNKRYIFGTLEFCVVEGDKAVIVSVGDSPAYFIHGDSISRVTKPKKTYSNLVEMGLYSQEELEAAVRRLLEHMWSMFDRYLPMVVPAYPIEEIPLEKGDMVVLCCDGVSDYLEPDWIKNALDRSCLPESAAAVLHKAKEQPIKERGRILYDDLTTAVYCH